MSPTSARDFHSHRAAQSADLAVAAAAQQQQQLQQQAKGPGAQARR